MYRGSGSSNTHTHTHTIAGNRTRVFRVKGGYTGPLYYDGRRSPVWDSNPRPRGQHAARSGQLSLTRHDRRERGEGKGEGEGGRERERDRERDRERERERGGGEERCPDNLYIGIVALKSFFSPTPVDVTPTVDAGMGTERARGPTRRAWLPRRGGGRVRRGG